MKKAKLVLDGVRQVWTHHDSGYSFGHWDADAIPQADRADEKKKIQLVMKAKLAGFYQCDAADIDLHLGLPAEPISHIPVEVKVTNFAKGHAYSSDVAGKAALSLAEAGRSSK